MLPVPLDGEVAVDAEEIDDVPLGVLVVTGGV